MRIAVIGIGNQGRHHIRFLQNLTDVELSFLIDRDSEKRKTSEEEFHIPCVADYQSHLDQFDAAIIAVPTVDHFEIASDLIRAGKHVLIEKPVTTTIEQAEELFLLATKQGIVAHVGFPERFNPAVDKAMPEITRPLFIETHRLGIFSPRSLDIDVVLDLMIHDLDLLYLFLKEEPSGIEAVGIPILSKNIDIANARLKFPGGCVVNLTASRVSAKKMRKMRLFQPYCYLSIDFADQSFTRFSLEPNLCNAGFPEIHHAQFQPKERENPLALELAAFRDAILKGHSRGVSIPDAVPSLRMAIAIKERFTLPSL